MDPGELGPLPHSRHQRRVAGGVGNRPLELWVLRPGYRVKPGMGTPPGTI